MNIKRLLVDLEKEIPMKNMQKIGAVAAFYLAIAYLIGIALFLVVLDYPSMVEPAQRAALLVSQPLVIYATNLIMYVVFGVVLAVLALALHERLQAAPPAIIQTATALGLIWAGALIVSGMVANAGIAPVAALYAKDPTQAALTWLSIETVANGLSGANGEFLGGLFTLLISWAALRAGGLPRWLNYLGMLVGAFGIMTTAPGLSDLTGLFGMGQIIWFVWLGIALLREGPGVAVPAIGASSAPRSAI